MIKKISLFMLSACISVALFGCSGKDKAENNSETASKQVVIENFGVTTEYDKAPSAVATPTILSSSPNATKVCAAS